MRFFARLDRLSHIVIFFISVLLCKRGVMKLANAVVF